MVIATKVRNLWKTNIRRAIEGRLRSTALVYSCCLCACVQTPPTLVLRATGQGHACTLRVNDVEVTREALGLGRLRSLRASHGDRAVVDTDLETPYRCIGGIIYDLQRAGFRAVAVSVNGVPISSD